MVWTQRLSGQNRQRGANDFRQPYERDRTRVIHSAAFRRLQQKTQIYGGHAGNFHRTRLTHSLEVASIGMSLVRHLRCIIQESSVTEHLPPDDLIYVICLLHDIGHPPFGHGGEAALNALMSQYGGFEGNAQSLRLVSYLENAYQPYGLDLTRRTLLGILKYPVARKEVLKRFPKNILQQQNRETWLATKGYYDEDEPLVEWILEPFTISDKTLFQSVNGDKKFHHSLDCSLMDIADDIAYGVHDLEDAIHMRLIVRNHLDNERLHEIFADIPELNHQDVLQGLFSFDPAQRKHTIGALVHYFVSSVSIENLEQFRHPLLRLQARLSPQAHRLLKALIHCVYDHVIDSSPARAQEFGSQNVLINLFEAIHSNPHRLLDSYSRTRLLMIKKEGDLERIICDFLANLSDDVAIRHHRKLFAEHFSAEWANYLFD